MSLLISLKEYIIVGLVDNLKEEMVISSFFVITIGYIMIQKKYIDFGILVL